MSPVIDVHSHLFSPGMIEVIHAETPYEAKVDLEAGTVSNFLGLSLPLQAEPARMAEGVELGVDVQFVSVRTTALFPPAALGRSIEDRVKLARVVNSYLGEITRKHGGFFRAFADVPLSMSDPSLGVEEAIRALDSEGLDGIMLYTNYEGVYLDAPEFGELWEEVNARRTVVFLHPTVVAGAPGVSDHRMYSMVGFPFDTTLSVARMIYTGMLDRHENVTVITSHAGGAIPFLWWRLGLGYRQNFLGIQTELAHSIEDYLQQRFLYDTALVDKSALEMTLDKVGSDRVVFGTDHPYSPNGISRTMATIESLDVDEPQRAAIFGNTVASLLSAF